MSKKELVVITGANGYFGSELCKGLEKNYYLASVVRNALLKTTSDKQFIIKNDLSIKGNLDALLHRIQEICTTNNFLLKGIVNNAFWINKIDNPASRSDAYEGVFRSQIDLILKLLPYMQSGGSVINISSMYANVAPNPGNYTDYKEINPLEYGAMKSALQSATRWLSAVYCQDTGIRFNSISFGPFPSLQSQSKEFNRTLSKSTHIGRIGLPHEVVGPVEFLLSDSSSYITGSNVVVDGGWTSW